MTNGWEEAGVILDDTGTAWPPYPLSLARQLGCPTGDFDVIGHAVRYCGYVHVAPLRDAVVVKFDPATVHRLAAIAAFYEIAGRAPRRLILAFPGAPGSSDRYEIFDDVSEGLERLEAAAAVFHNSTAPAATPAAPCGRLSGSGAGAKGGAIPDADSPTDDAPTPGGSGEFAAQTRISGRFWRREAPPPLSAPPDPLPSRAARTLKAIARSAGWMAPPGGLALIALAAWLTLHLLPASRSIAEGAPAAALLRASSPRLAPAIAPGLPAGPSETRSQQVQAALSAIAPAMTGPAVHKKVRWPIADHRSRFNARRASFAYRRTPVVADRCPYQCSWAQAMRGGDD